MASTGAAGTTPGGRRETDPAAPAAVLLELEDVSFTYRGAATPALCDVSLQLRRGEFVVVMGATGAGKSTLAKCLNRSIPHFQPGTLNGRIVFAGRDIAQATVAELAGEVGLVTQDFEAQLFATTVRHEIAFGMEQLGVPREVMAARLRSALHTVGLDGFERRDPVSLSGGEKQRLAIAALLALEPALLVLDEPTTDLDPLGKAEVFAALAALRARGATVLLIEHETEAAVHADRLVLMAGGRIVADDAPATLLPEVERLAGLGVRPLDLDRIGAALGWRERAASPVAAAARLRRRPDARPPVADESVPPAEVVLAAEDVVFSYGGGSAALDGISLRIARGEFVALIGQNGSGKTTLAKCLNGLLVPQRGMVRLHDTDIRRVPLAQRAAQVGYVFQDPDQQLFAATVREEVAFALVTLGYPPDDVERRVRRVLTAVGLEGVADRDPFLLGKGERQRLAVAALLALEPEVLILDEPTTGLDFPEQQRMLALLAELHRGGLTLVVITHSPWVVAETAARGVVVRGGRIAFDGPLRALFANDELLTAARFRVPDATRVGRALGCTPLSVDELLASIEPA